MTTATILTALTDILAMRIDAMTSALEQGDGLGVARIYADDALLTDLHDFRVLGRAAIDAHWSRLAPCRSWRLDILDVGGDPAMPYQRLHSTLIFERNGQEIRDVGTCFVIWKRQADGDYRIYVDIYRPATNPV
ncbi:MAG: YybH family protein [Roseiflexaceae bacterium]